MTDCRAGGQQTPTVRARQDPLFNSVSVVTALILLLVAAYALSAAASGDFEELIGLAGIHPVEGACLAIRVPGLPEGTVVTLVEPQARKILDARITGQLEGSCVSGSAIPGLVGTHDDSTYRLEILKGNPRKHR